MNLPEPPSSGPEPPSARLRASDADRDRVADRLREALAEGRITPEEHAERIDAVYRAKTYADLEPVLHDLPDAGGAPGPAAAPKVSLDKDAAPPPVAQSPTMVAVFSGAVRKGRWLVEPHTNITCVFGGVELDFREAVLSQREITLNISCLFGGVDITVPPGVRVVNSGNAVFGGHDIVGDDTADPEAPVIRLTGLVLFGGVSVKRREAGATRADRRRERHELHHRLREQRHALHEEHHALREEHRQLHDARRDHLRAMRDQRRRRA